MNNKELVCCFTGHRPKSLPWGYEEKGSEYRKFIKELNATIKALIKNGVYSFISGMAQGFDIIAAEQIIKLKKAYSNIKLECAIPCQNQNSGWSEDYKKRYNNILNRADKITYVSNYNYFNGCMAKRNKYMIDKSTHLIALYNGTAGGTHQTIGMGKKKELIIHIINS